MATAITATQLTVSDAAAHVGVTRQTIFKQIKSGKLSATTNRKGHKQLNVVELIRVYGELQSPEQVAQNRINRPHQDAPATATAGLQLELELAKLRITHAEKELATATRQLEEMKVRERQSIDDRTQLLGVIERQTLLLAAPRPAPRAKPAAKAAPAPAKAPTRAKPAPAKPKAAPAKPVVKAPTRSKNTDKAQAKQVITSNSTAESKTRKN